jgi:hypothetical protein
MEDPLSTTQADAYLVALSPSSVIGAVPISETAPAIVGTTATADLNILERPYAGPRGDVLAARRGALVPLSPGLTVDGAAAPVGVPVSPRADLQLPSARLRFRIVPASAVRAFAEHQAGLELCWALGHWVHAEHAVALARDDPDMKKVGCSSLPLFSSRAQGLRVLVDGALVAVSGDADGVTTVLRAARSGFEALSLAELGVALSTILPMEIADVDDARQWASCGLPVEPPHHEPGGAVFCGVQGNKHSYGDSEQESDRIIDIGAFHATTVYRIIVDDAAERVHIDTSWTGKCTISIGLRGLRERIWSEPG